MFFCIFKLYMCLDERKIVFQINKESAETFNLSSELDLVLRNLEELSLRLSQHKKPKNLNKFIENIEEFFELKDKCKSALFLTSELYDLNSKLVFFEKIVHPERSELLKLLKELNVIISIKLTLLAELNQSYEVIRMQYNELLDDINLNKKNKKSINVVISEINLFIKTVKELKNQAKSLVKTYDNLKLNLISDVTTNNITILTYKKGNKWSYKDIHAYSLFNDTSVNIKEMIKIIQFFNEISVEELSTKKITQQSFLNFTDHEIFLIKKTFFDIKKYRLFYKNSLNSFIETRLKCLKNQIFPFSESLEYIVLNLDSQIESLLKIYDKKISILDNLQINFLKNNGLYKLEPEICGYVKSLTMLLDNIERTRSRKNDNVVAKNKSLFFNQTKKPDGNKVDMFSRLNTIFDSNTDPYTKKNTEFFYFLVSKIQKCEGLLKDEKLSMFKPKLHEVYNFLNNALNLHFKKANKEISEKSDNKTENKCESDNKEHVVLDKPLTSAEDKDERKTKNKEKEYKEKIFNDEIYECKMDDRLEEILFKVNASEAKVKIGNSVYKVRRFKK